MQTQKIVNLLNSSENKYTKLGTENCYVIDSESKGAYLHEHPIKFLTSWLESGLCDYSAYVLVTWNIAVVGANNNKKVALKNRPPFRKCRTEIIETFIDEAEHVNIAMDKYNLAEYSDNYSNTSGSLWQFKRDEIERDVDGNHIPNNSSSFKYKSSLITNKNGVKIAVPLKYFSDFWRLLETPLINCKVELSLLWNPNYVLSNLVGASTFTITDARLYAPIVTLSIEDNVKLSKLLGKLFKRRVYWNKYKIISNKTYNENDYIRELLDSMS